MVQLTFVNTGLQITSDTYQIVLLETLLSLLTVLWCIHPLQVMVLDQMVLLHQHKTID